MLNIISQQQNASQNHIHYIFKKAGNNKCWQRCVKKKKKKGTLVYTFLLASGNVNIAAVLETSLAVKCLVSIWPSNSTSRYIPKKNRNICLKNMYTIFIAALFIIIKKWKYQNVHEVMNVVYPCNGIFLGNRSQRYSGNKA